MFFPLILEFEYIFHPLHSCLGNPIFRLFLVCVFSYTIYFIFRFTELKSNTVYPLVIVYLNIITVYFSLRLFKFTVSLRIPYIYTAFYSIFMLTISKV